MVVKNSSNSKYTVLRSILLLLAPNHALNLQEYLILKVRRGQFRSNSKINQYLRVWFNPIERNIKNPDRLIDKGRAPTVLSVVHTPTRRGFFNPCVYISSPPCNGDLSLDIPTHIKVSIHSNGPIQKQNLSIGSIRCYYIILQLFVNLERLRTSISLSVIQSSSDNVSNMGMTRWTLIEQLYEVH